MGEPQSGGMEKWPGAPARGSVLRMKALVAIVLLFALVAFALLWPVGGRSFWQRAKERGLPDATARLAARGLRSTWDLLFDHNGSPPTRPAPVAPVRRPSRRVDQPRVATSGLAGSFARPGRTDRTGGPDRTADRDAASGPDRTSERGAVPAAGPDRIVAQPARETLQQNDRAGLEKLLRAR